MNEAAFRSVVAAARRMRSLAAVVMATCWLGGCALVAPQAEDLRAAWPESLPPRVELTAVPFFAQQDYQCGPAALGMLLATLRVDVTPEQLLDEVYLPARKGALQAEMLAAPRRHGVLSYPLAPRFEDLLREVAAGNPAIVLQDNGLGLLSAWHYAVIVGYDRVSGEAILRSGDDPRRRVSFAALEFTWAKSGYWSMVVVPPDRIPATATEAEYLSAALALARTAPASAARDAFAALLVRWPDNLGASVGLANSYYKLGEVRRSESVLRRAAARHPDSVVVLNNLAQVVADLGRRNEALAWADRAVALGGPFAEAARRTRTAILRSKPRTRGE